MKEAIERRARSMSPYLLVGMVAVLLMLNQSVRSGEGDDDDDGDNGDLEAAREAVEVYEDLDQALADGYEQATDCFSDPELGAQGFHFLNFALLDDVLDPTKPELLMYIPTEDGLEFVGVEYAVPADLVPPIPSLFGQEFHPFPPAPDDPQLFVLHVWLLEDVPNPSGLFADWNPNLSCDVDDDDDDDEDDDEDEDDDDD